MEMEMEVDESGLESFYEQKISILSVNPSNVPS